MRLCATTLLISLQFDAALAQFTTNQDDFSAIPERTKSGNGCVEGVEQFLATYDLCSFSCAYGFCPETLCKCIKKGKLRDLPSTTNRDVVETYDVLSVNLNHLCKFACKYGHCPPETCQIAVSKPRKDGKNKREQDENDDRVPDVVTVPPDFNEDSAKNRDKNDKQCFIYKDGYEDPEQLAGCKKACQETLDKAKQENRTNHYGCILWSPESEGGLKSIPWQRQPSTGRLVTGGKCSCDNWLANDTVDYFIEALPAIAQIGCFILMSALKLVIDVGLSIFGGRTLTAGVAEIKQAFDILGFAPKDKSSYKEPTKIKKHSGKKGDEGNPQPQPETSKGVSPIKPKPSNTRRKKCSIKPEDQAKTVGVAQNTIELRSCNSKDETVMEYSVISTMTHEPLASRAKVKVNCSAVWNQTCYNYSAVIQESSRWSTFTLRY